MSVVDNRIVTHALIYTDDASHNTPSYIYAKQYDKNSRYVNIKLMSADGQVVVSTPSKLNATKPDGNTLYISGTTEADGTVTFKIAASIIDQIGVVSCDVTVLDGSTQESVLLTSSTFYITVDKTNYDLDAPEASDDYVMAARAGDLATSVVEGETILHLVDTNGDAMGHGVPFSGGGSSGVQPDWDQNDSSAPDYIKHKPTIPAPITVDSTVTSAGTNPVSGSGIYAAIQTAIQDAQFDYNNYVDIGLISPTNSGTIMAFSIDSEKYDAIEASYNTRTDSTVVFRIGESHPTHYLVHKATTVDFDGVALLGYSGIAVDGISGDSGTVIVGFSNSICLMHIEYIRGGLENAIEEANTYTDTLFAAAESITNKTNTISSSSTNTEYPSAKAVYDALALVSNGIYEMQPFASSIKMTDTQYVVTYKGIDKNAFLTHGSSLHIVKFGISINNTTQNFYGFSNGLQIDGSSVTFVITGVTINNGATGSVPFIAKFNCMLSYPTSDDSGFIALSEGGGIPAVHTHTLQDIYASAADEALIGNGDGLIFSDSSDSGKLKIMPNMFDEDAITEYLCRDGTWKEVDLSGKFDKTGGEISGDVILLKEGTSPGDSQALIFQRGTLTDNYNDWRIQDRGGYLYFDQRGSGSSSWTNQVVMNTNGNITASSFSGSGASLTNINASNIASGTLSAARLPTIDSEKIIKSAANTTIASNDVLPIFDSSDSNKLKGSIVFDTSNDTLFLRQDGTWASPPIGEELFSFSVTVLDLLYEDANNYSFLFDLNKWNEFKSFMTNTNGRGTVSISSYFSSLLNGATLYGKWSMTRLIGEETWYVFTGTLGFPSSSSLTPSGTFSFRIPFDEPELSAMCFIHFDSKSKTSELINDGSNGTSPYLESNGTAYKTTSIPYGEVDATSTATAYTATVPGITELRDGVCMWLKNGVVTSAEGFTINVNNLGAKPSYTNLAAATRDTTLFNANYTFLFVYDSTRVSGGCWVCYRGYDANTNTIGYQLRTNSSTLKTASKFYRYRLLFTSADGTKWIPANTSSSTNATAARTVNQAKIDPFGAIVYYSSTTAINADANVTATVIWQQYTLTLGYSFNRTGAALILTYPAPVYVKAAPQLDGSAIIDADNPYVQSLPTTEDGKIYIYLGRAYSATAIELQMTHPVYQFKNGAIVPWVPTASITVSGTKLVIKT